MLHPELGRWIVGLAVCLCLVVCLLILLTPSDGDK